MELRALRYFVAIAHAGNMNKAAHQLRVAQPALSRQIRILEDELGIELFERLPRGVRLTVAGKGFLEDAEHVLWASEQARQRASLASRGAIGQLKVGLYGHAVQHQSVRRSLYEFSRRHPNVTLLLQHLTSDQQIQAVLDDQIDIGFAYHLGSMSLRVRTKVVELDHTRLVLREDHPLASSNVIEFADLRDENFLTIDPEVNRRSWQTLHANCTSAGFVPRIMVEGINSIPWLLGLVSAGLGVSMVGQSAADNAPKNLVFREIAGAREPLQIVCLSHPLRRSLFADEMVRIVDDRLSD
jgi:DNA-binding transcriptional LysR family regulator